MLKNEKNEEIEKIYKKYLADLNNLEKKRDSIFFSFIKKMEEYKMKNLLSTIKNSDESKNI